MCACPSRVFEFTQRSFDMDLRSTLKRIVTNSRQGLATGNGGLPSQPCIWGLGAKLLRLVGIVASGHIFDNVFVGYATLHMDIRLDVCVDLIGTSPLTQTRMVDFVVGRTVVDAAQRKRVKYEAKYATSGYGILLFSFSSLRELDNDVVALLKRIRKFPMTQNIGSTFYCPHL
nr:hypothetical protein [Tanacetum cinerariifolium]